MRIIRAIAPDWAMEANPTLKKVVEGELSDEDIIRLNESFYNIYFLPNHPSIYEGGSVSGYQIDTFSYVFVDFDLKDKAYPSKGAFLQAISDFSLTPTAINDSGNGIHVYWKISDLDVMSYLRLQRRLIRKFNTDEAVGQIYQLMRLPDTINTKSKDEFKECHSIWDTPDVVYSSEEMDRALPSITIEDENYCQHHYQKTYKIQNKELQIDDTIPLKFAQLMENNNEVKDIWLGKTDDRSASDFRLGHIMFASGFSKSEASSVLVNTAKALCRSPAHRVSYSTNIVDKIWTYEISDNKQQLTLSSSVKDILKRSGSSIKGTRLPCWTYIDNTEAGFKLGQVIGLVAGSGVGKTAIALNMFLGFVQNNPDYDHFFIPLEQPANEIADRWKTMCQGKEQLYEKVQILSNYEDSGQFRHLSFDEIRDYVVRYQEVTGRKIGCIVIDHIGALKKKGKDGENQDLMDICHAMKAFAIKTNTLLIMQSQAPRAKAGKGDLELNKDAAYGTMYFEAYCDYLITLWQPLKTCYAAGAPTVTAFKFCKIRHKKQDIDKIKEDVCYKLMFDSKTELLRPLTQKEEVSFDFFLHQAAQKRKNEETTDAPQYISAQFEVQHA